MKPFFTRLGGKYRSAAFYPVPMCATIIEPFAGSAGYAVRYAEYGMRVDLYDIDPVIYGIWDYLVHVSETEIRRIPVAIDHVDQIKGPQESRWLVGFWFNKGTENPRQQRTAWSVSRPNSHWGVCIRERIAVQVSSIRNWKVFCKSYESAPNRNATWFVDPPYFGTTKYQFNGNLNYRDLATWCRCRNGQVIVCELKDAHWLPFHPLPKCSKYSSRRTGVHKERLEYVWTQGMKK